MEEFVTIEPQECLQSRKFLNGVNVRIQTLPLYRCSYLDITVQICIKPISTDIHVSGSIKREGAWELETVNNVIKAMQKFPEATFLDIGANLGMYAVVIAAMKRRVVAVDADPINLAYIRKSLDLEGNTGNVRIIYNSVR